MEPAETDVQTPGFQSEHEPGADGDTVSGRAKGGEPQEDGRGFGGDVATGATEDTSTSDRPQACVDQDGDSAEDGTRPASPDDEAPTPGGTETPESTPTPDDTPTPEGTATPEGTPTPDPDSGIPDRLLPEDLPSLGIDAADEYRPDDVPLGLP